MSTVTDETILAACRAMCKSNGTGQCAPICLSRFSIHTQGGACPEATRVYRRSAKAALEAAEAVRVKASANCGQDAMWQGIGAAMKRAAEQTLTMRVDSDPRVSQSAAFMTPAEKLTIPEGFIPWHGGDCPVDGKTIGDVLLRSGLRLEQAKMGHQSWDYWQSASKTDIIASANPATILALVAHIRELAADKERYRDLAKRNAERAAFLANDGYAEISRLRAERAKLVEAARPVAYLVEGDFYPTKCEVKRLRAAIEEVNRE